MKRAVIATNVGGNPDMMKDGVTGFLVEKGNHKQLIEKIKLLLADKKLSEQIGKIHEEGIENVIGHTSKNKFSQKITRRKILRTQSTSTSVRYFKELGEKHKNGIDINGKYFYIAHNFRNEAVDATHLAEFFQGEGFIIGDNLSLADLMGFIKEYYKKLGITKRKNK